MKMQKIGVIKGGHLNLYFLVKPACGAPASATVCLFAAITASMRCVFAI